MQYLAACGTNSQAEADFRFPVLITEPESADDSQEYIEDQECHKGYPVTDGIRHSVCKIKSVSQVVVRVDSGKYEITDIYLFPYIPLEIFYEFLFVEPGFYPYTDF